MASFEDLRRGCAAAVREADDGADLHRTASEQTASVDDVGGLATHAGDLVGSGDLTTEGHVVERQLRPQQRVVDHRRYLPDRQLTNGRRRVVGARSGRWGVHATILSALPRLPSGTLADWCVELPTR